MSWITVCFMSSWFIVNTAQHQPLLEVIWDFSLFIAEKIEAESVMFITTDVNDGLWSQQILQHSKVNRSDVQVTSIVSLDTLLGVDVPAHDMLCVALTNCISTNRYSQPLFEQSGLFPALTMPCNHHSQNSTKKCIMVCFSLHPTNVQFVIIGFSVPE